MSFELWNDKKIERKPLPGFEPGTPSFFDYLHDTNITKTEVFDVTKLVL